jgi:hypothetical protein
LQRHYIGGAAVETVNAIIPAFLVVLTSGRSGFSGRYNFLIIPSVWLLRSVQTKENRERRSAPKKSPRTACNSCTTRRWYFALQSETEIGSKKD